MRSARSRRGWNVAANAEDALPDKLSDDRIPDTIGNDTLSARNLILNRVGSIVVRKNQLVVTLRAPRDQDQDEATSGRDGHRRERLNNNVKMEDDQEADRLSIPFVPNQPLHKGIAPGHGAGPAMIDTKTREVLLLAIARSSRWMQQITSGSKAFDQIAGPCSASRSACVPVAEDRCSDREWIGSCRPDRLRTDPIRSLCLDASGTDARYIADFAP